MKRCNNCGWYNRNELTKCEKCGEPLGLPLEELESHETEETKVVPSFEPGENGRVYSATMRDTGAVQKTFGGETETRICPKCSYPLVGDDEVCPNCGTKLHGATRKDASHLSRAGKMTIREVPKELTDVEPEPTQDIFKLVSVSDPNYPDVYLSVGDIVTIGSRRFRFEK